jgi:hypothetical protein
MILRQRLLPTLVPERVEIEAGLWKIWWSPYYERGRQPGDITGVLMQLIPRRYTHFVFGVIQSGLTSLIAAGIASWPLWESGRFLLNWMASWLISWVVMLPAVLFAAPAIRWLAVALTHEDEAAN